MWHYYAEVLDITDGDTLKLRIDVGFFIKIEAGGRLLGVNCHETRGAAAANPEELRLGKLEKEFTANWVKTQAKNNRVVIRSVKPDKYAGRWDVRVFASDAPDAPELTLALIKAGMYKDIPNY